MEPRFNRIILFDGRISYAVRQVCLLPVCVACRARLHACRPWLAPAAPLPAWCRLPAFPSRKGLSLPCCLSLSLAADCVCCPAASLPCPAQVEGTQDPLDARISLIGWLRQPELCLKGGSRLLGAPLTGQLAGCGHRWLVAQLMDWLAAGCEWTIGCATAQLVTDP